MHTCRHLTCRVCMLDRHTACCGLVRFSSITHKTANKTKQMRSEIVHQHCQRARATQSNSSKSNSSKSSRSKPNSSKSNSSKPNSSKTNSSKPNSRKSSRSKPNSNNAIKHEHSGTVHDMQGYPPGARLRAQEFKGGVPAWRSWDLIRFGFRVCLYINLT